MVLKVRNGVPLVWRSPSSLQFGVDEPLVVLDDVDEGSERLIGALVGGISSTGFEMMARSAGMPSDAASELLARLERVLASETADAAAPGAQGELRNSIKNFVQTWTPGIASALDLNATPGQILNKLTTLSAGKMESEDQGKRGGIGLLDRRGRAREYQKKNGKNALGQHLVLGVEVEDRL